jgi:hypothetical protein
MRTGGDALIAFGALFYCHRRFPPRIVSRLVSSNSYQSVPVPFIFLSINDSNENEDGLKTPELNGGRGGSSLSSTGILRRSGWTPALAAVWLAVALFESRLMLVSALFMSTLFFVLASVGSRRLLSALEQENPILDASSDVDDFENTMVVDVVCAAASIVFTTVIVSPGLLSQPHAVDTALPAAVILLSVVIIIKWVMEALSLPGPPSQPPVTRNGLQKTSPFQYWDRLLENYEEVPDGEEEQK